MSKRVFNIVWRSKYGVEVVDHAPTRKEAQYLVKEYKTAFNEGHVFIKWDLI